MKALVAIVMGFFAGLLIYFMAAMLFADFSAGSAPSTAFLLVSFLGAWVASAILLMRGAQTVSAVFRRGFLLGAAEWLTMAMVGLVFSGRLTNATIADTPDSGAAAAGAAIGGGIAAAVVGGFAVFMAVVCLIGFAIAYFIGPEMKNKAGTPTKKCPQCAEMIQAEAQKCRFCGSVFQSTSSTQPQQP